MNPACVAHGHYLAAIADGELEMVPDATRNHVDHCPECAREVAAHSQLGEALRASILGSSRALISDSLAATPGRRRWLRAPAVAVAAAALLLAVVSTTIWRAASDRDPVALAVSATRHGAVLSSSDARTIASWCSSNSDRRQPPIALTSLTPVGARMDTGSGTTVVTIFYRDASGHRITVGWTDAAPLGPTETRAEVRTTKTAVVIVLQTPAGSAVVGGGAPLPVLWAVAGAVESAGAT